MIIEDGLFWELMFACFSNGYSERATDQIEKETGSRPFPVDFIQEEIKLKFERQKRFMESILRDNKNKKYFP